MNEATTPLTISTSSKDQLHKADALGGKMSKKFDNSKQTSTSTHRQVRTPCFQDFIENY